MQKKDDTRENRVTVEILGDSYTLLGDSPPSYIEMVADFVNTDLKSLKERQPRLSRNRLFVLALLNMAERYFSEREKVNHLHDDNRKLKKDLKALEREMKERKSRKTGGEE